VALAPSDSIVLTTAAHELLQAAIQDLAGSEISVRELHTSGGLAVLNYLRRRHKDAQARLRERIAAHAGIRKVLGYLDQSMVLGAGRASSLTARLARSTATVRDLEALRRVAQQLAEAKPAPRN